MRSILGIFYNISWVDNECHLTKTTTIYEILFETQDVFEVEWDCSGIPERRKIKKVEVPSVNSNDYGFLRDIDVQIKCFPDDLKRIEEEVQKRFAKIFKEREKILVTMREMYYRMSKDKFFTKEN